MMTTTQSLIAYIQATRTAIQRTIEAKHAANAAPISATRESVDSWTCTSGPRAPSDDAPSTLRSPSFALSEVA